MYHTHFDELRQQFGGLVGALVVLEPGERWDPERDLIFLLSDGTTPQMFINGSLAPAPKELEVGLTYRLRIADIAAFRMALSVRLLRDSTLVQWRPIAKDGFALPPAQATMRPSIANVPSGETADFEFTPDAPGDLLLVVGPPGGAPQGSLRLRVTGRR
jgi:manganese oxidase